MTDSKIASRIKGKNILITGGTGSFGNAVTRQLLKFSPNKIYIFSRDEKKQFDMMNQFSDHRLVFFFGGRTRSFEC